MGNREFTHEEELKALVAARNIIDDDIYVEIERLNGEEPDATDKELIDGMRETHQILGQIVHRYKALIEAEKKNSPTKN